MKRVKILLLLILVVAFGLRFYRLGSYPALNADEAAIGYNVYSLLATGKDEHGNYWPIHFQSFNDYKPGLYFYLALPFVKILGLNEWAVRIPGAAMGALTVLVVYLLVNELFDKERLGLIAALFLAISPWHIHYSRGGWEVNAATFLITLGLWLFIKKKYVVSVLAFVAALYTYHAARVVVPLLGAYLLMSYWGEIKVNFRKAGIGVLVGAVLLIPLVIDFTRGGALARAAGAGLFADAGPLSRIEEQRGEHPDFRGILARVFHNKAVNYGLAFAENLTDHFSGEFIFLSGDEIQRNRVPETGQVYLLELLFIAIGFVMIVRRPKGWGVILGWLLVAPVAAALTFQAPHALRANNMVVPLVIVSAFGFDEILTWLSARKRLEKMGVIVLVIGLMWSFARYMHMYWVHMAKEYPYSSQYGVKELVNYVAGNQDKYQKILVTNRYDQPYILFLFYSKYPPDKFQTEHTLTARDGYGFSTVNNFNKYYFASIKFDEARPENPNSLIIGTDGEIPEEANIVKDVYGTNGFKYFQVVAN